MIKFVKIFDLKYDILCWSSGEFQFIQSFSQTYYIYFPVILLRNVYAFNGLLETNQKLHC